MVMLDDVATLNDETKQVDKRFEGGVQLADCVRILGIAAYFFDESGDGVLQIKGRPGVFSEITLNVAKKSRAEVYVSAVSFVEHEANDVKEDVEDAPRKLVVFILC